MFDIDIRELAKSDGGKYSIESLDSAYNFCKEITTSHYENFPVASVLIPKSKRKFIYSVYSFARIADDIADEIDDKEEKLALLNNYRDNLSKINLSNPIFFALENTIKTIGLSKENFHLLLDAFEQDINFIQPRTWEDNFEYCKKSANPVGRIILEIFGLKDKELLEYSDMLCTGLQLTNFWQDISVDKLKNRCFIPLSILEKYNVKDIYEIDNNEDINKIIDELISITEEKFEFGSQLISHLKPYRLKLEIAITLNGGRSVLKKIKQLRFNVLENRAKLYKLDYVDIILKSIF